MAFIDVGLQSLTRDLNCFVSFRFAPFFFVVVGEASPLSLTSFSLSSSDSILCVLTVFRFFFALPSSSLSLDAVVLNFPFNLDFGVGLSSSSCLMSNFRFLISFAGGFSVSSSSEGGGP